MTKRELLFAKVYKRKRKPKESKDYVNDNSAKQTCPSNEGEHP